MKQYELATLLGVTPAVVTRLKRRGMPTDSLERAQRWRKRHLEPGRVKGAKLAAANGPRKAPSSKPAEKIPAAQSEPGATSANWADIVHLAQQAGDALLKALEHGEAIEVEFHSSELRSAVREIPPNPDEPRLPIGAWLTLIDHALSDLAPVRTHYDKALVVTPRTMADLIRPGSDSWPEWFGIACESPDLALDLDDEGDPQENDFQNDPSNTERTTS